MESSTTAKGFSDISKFSDAKLYEIWRLAVDDLLYRHKVKRYVEGKKPRPEEISGCCARVWRHILLAAPHEQQNECATSSNAP
jgi:hypothetical protein